MSQDLHYCIIVISSLHTSDSLIANAVKQFNVQKHRGWSNAEIHKTIF